MQPHAFLSLIHVSMVDIVHMSRDMTKQTKWLCVQRRFSSSAQSDQSLRCPHKDILGPQLPTERTAKTLIRLGGSADGQADLILILLILSCRGSNLFY